jgi:exonuclease VII large subunit
MRLAVLDADVVILARGGGSAVRLPYDTEVVARAVATCPVPVIAAVGHAGDRSLADEVAWRSVAWRSAATPSAAAGLVSSLIADADRQIVEFGREIAALSRRHLDKARRDLDRLEVAIAQRPLASPPGPFPHPPPPAAPLDETRWRHVALIAAATAFGALMTLVIVLAVLR